MGTKAEKRAKKPPILRWHGLLSTTDRQARWAVGIILSVASAVFAFTQLGFVAVDLPDGGVAYIVVLLPIVALGSLLLGTLAGTALGLTAGAVLLVHAQILPLDHFELLYVNPFTSIILLGLAGLTMGIFFAFALRKNPPQIRRILYIAIISIVTAWVYSMNFSASTYVSLIIDIAEKFQDTLSTQQVEDMARMTAVRLGNTEVQAWATAGLTALSCCLVDWAARRTLAHQGTFGLRAVFGAWLSVAVALTFMAMAAISFMVTTGDQLNSAEQNMKSDIDYLCIQLEESSNQSHAIYKLINDLGISLDSFEKEDFDNLLASANTARLLESFSPKEHGTVIITWADLIDMSNVDTYEQYEKIDDILSRETIDAINASIETGQMQRFVYDGVKQAAVDMDSAERPYIAYLMARDISLANAEGEEFDNKVIVFQSSDQVFATRGSVMQWLTVSSLALMLIVGAIVIFLLNRLIARRIDEENSALESITAGDLAVRATAGGTREFDSLTNGINDTVDALKGWISEAETRMDAELATAKAIQESALPRTFPPFPDILKFDIYASMQPAKQVGGDFYDFFLIGDDSDADSGKLGFVVADVSGKGVPAALFMMKAKALIRDYVGSGMELGEAITEANRQICDGNDAGMFVTAWVGVLDYVTGHVDYVNAGHNPPLLWSFAAASDGEGDNPAESQGWSWLTERSGLPLGLFEGMPYTAYSIDCLPGDMFILYSDGVTEAMDVNDGLYGEERLMTLAQKHYLEHPQRLLESVRRDVAAHAAGAEQSDDITVLTLEVGVPPEVTATLEVPAENTQIHNVNEFLHAELDRRLCPKRVQSQLDLVVEELFVNVCRYAYADSGTTGMVKVQRTYSADPPCVKVKLIDEGVAFNPLEKPDVDLPTSVDDMTIGGLGLFMVKQLVDDIRYERLDDSNVVTIIKKW